MMRPALLLLAASLVCLAPSVAVAQWHQCQAIQVGNGWRATANRYLDETNTLRDTMWRVEIEALAQDLTPDDQISMNTRLESSLPPIGSMLLEVGQRPGQPALGHIQVLAPGFYDEVAHLFAGLNGTSPAPLPHYLQWTADREVLLSAQVPFLSGATSAEEVGSGAEVAAVFMGHSDSERPGPGGEADAIEAAHLIELFLSGTSGEVTTFVEIEGEGGLETLAAGQFVIRPDTIRAAEDGLRIAQAEADRQVEAGECL